MRPGCRTHQATSVPSQVLNRFKRFIVFVFILLDHLAYQTTFRNFFSRFQQFTVYAILKLVVCVRLSFSSVFSPFYTPPVISRLLYFSDYLLGWSCILVLC